jgi:integrase
MAKQNKIVYDANGVEFTVYETVKSTKAGLTRYWLLEDYSSGKRRLLSNKTKKAAEERADKIRAAMVKGQASRMALNNGEWQDVCMALEIVKSVPRNLSLAAAVGEWGTCIGVLDGKATLLEAVRFYLSHRKDEGPPFKPTRLADAAPRYHESKVAAGKSKSHCKNISSRLGRLEIALPNNVKLDELTAGQLDAALLTLNIGPKTRNEYRIMLSNFYRWAGKQNPPLVRAEFNPAKEMEHHRTCHQEVEFLRVVNLRKILVGVQTQRPDLLMLVALVCFAGLRPSEAVRVEWEEIGEDYIRLPGSKTKTNYSRQIPIQANLRRWLAQCRKESGLVCPDVSLEHINAAILRISGIQLEHDAMRHGYGTRRSRRRNGRTGRRSRASRMGLRKQQFAAAGASSGEAFRHGGRH